VRRIALVVVFVLLGVAHAPASDALAVPVGKFDYQLGGAYPPPAGVTFVVRDRLDLPAAGKYNACYVNAFQAQESERAWWDANHPDLLLRDASGKVVVDADWNEALLDIGTAAKRRALLAIVGRWIDRCKADGFAAVDPDNLDSYTRSKGLLSAAHAVAFAKLLIARAHNRGMPIAQKNAAELTGRAPFDFAVVEQCQQYDECGVYKRAYGKHILEVEYATTPFTNACTNLARTWPVIRRDRNLAPKGTPGYVYRSC
jgi:Glycoside-hydrolase family GH114